MEKIFRLLSLLFCLIFPTILGYFGVFHTKKTIEKFDSLSGRRGSKNPTMPSGERVFQTRVCGIGGMFMGLIILVIFVLYFLGIVDIME